MVDVVKVRPGLLDAAKSVLVMVDMQQRLLSAMQSSAAQLMLDNSIKLVQAAKCLNVPILLTEQYPKGLGSTVDDISHVLPEAALCFEKTAFSCCGCDEFKQKLITSGRRQVVLVGQETHVCVLQTAVELFQQGFQVFVVEDAVCSRLEQHKVNAIERMRQLGVNVTCYESVLFEWIRDAKHANFKTISALVR